jgi:hypothetical protein
VETKAEIPVGCPRFQDTFRLSRFHRALQTNAIVKGLQVGSYASGIPAKTVLGSKVNPKTNETNSASEWWTAFNP